MQAESDGLTMQGHPEVKSTRRGVRGVCANCSQRVPGVQSGRPHSIIKHTGQARVLKGTRGQKPGGAWNGTRGAGKVKDKRGRAPKTATKGTSVPKVRFLGPAEGR